MAVVQKKKVLHLLYSGENENRTATEVFQSTTSQQSQHNVMMARCSFGYFNLPWENYSRANTYTLSHTHTPQTENCALYEEISFGFLTFVFLYVNK